MVPPTTQRFMATRAKAKLTEIQQQPRGDVFHPTVAALIEAAAADAK